MKIHEREPRDVRILRLMKDGRVVWSHSRPPLEFTFCDCFEEKDVGKYSYEAEIRRGLKVEYCFHLGEQMIMAKLQ